MVNPKINFFFCLTAHGTFHPQNWPIIYLPRGKGLLSRPIPLKINNLYPLVQPIPLPLADATAPFSNVDRREAWYGWSGGEFESEFPK
jgi:hypothetical protein